MDDDLNLSAVLLILIATVGGALFGLVWQEVMSRWGKTRQADHV